MTGCKCNAETVADLDVLGEAEVSPFDRDNSRWDYDCGVYITPARQAWIWTDVRHGASQRCGHGTSLLTPRVCL